MPIIIVPTSHVAGESLRAVEKSIRQHAPDCVAIELDNHRYAALKAPGGRRPGLQTGLFYFALQHLQQMLAKKTGILPGSEMLKAVDIAQSLNIQTAFIDQDIFLTINGIRGMPLTEKLKLAAYAIFGSLLFDSAGFDLNRVPDQVAVRKMVLEIRKRFPYLYRALIADRDKVMAANLLHLSQHFHTVVAVVGAGHVHGITRLLVGRAKLTVQ
ncbi:MAG: TraB/GumN family protein [Candidatus Aenigmarchaeota archaeon]|nr:TraB/GumN family protein [Candidatus Aenigmarchaeota archaeon]